MKKMIKAMLVMALALVLTLSLTCVASCEEGQGVETPTTDPGTPSDNPAETPADPEPADPEPVGPIKATEFSVEGSFANTLEQDTTKYIQVVPNGTYQIKVTLTPAESNSKVEYKVESGYEWAISVDENGLVSANFPGASKLDRDNTFCNKAVVKVTCEEFTRYLLFHIEEEAPYVSSRNGVIGEKLKTVSLPSNWYWKDSSEYIEEGTNYYVAIYKPSNLDNRWYGLTQKVKVYGEDEEEEKVDSTEYIYFDRSSTSKNVKMDTTLKFYIKRRNSRTIKKYEITVKDQDGNIVYEDDEKISSSKSSYTIELKVDDEFEDCDSITVQIKAWDNKDETWKSDKYKYTITGKKVTITKGGIIGDKMSRKHGYFSTTFRDVKASNWFYPYVVSAYEYDLLLGSNGYFKPNSNITIAETIALASRINAIYNEKTVIFDQTEGTNWYDTYVEYATKNNIINSSMFLNYNKSITREDFVKVLYNSLPAKEYDALNYIKMNDIPDYKVINKYANEVYAFYNAGILTGTDRWGTFKPDKNITRAEVSTIITRLCKLTDREYFSIK